MALGFSGCPRGNLTEDIATLDTRDLAGIATQSNGPWTPVAFAPRATFGSDNSAAALGYNDLTATEAALMDKNDPNSPIHFFITSHTDAEGVGPLFNQRRCLGCHFNSEDIKDNHITNDLGPLNTVNTPVSRAGRQGATNYALIHDNIRPNTAAFTLFGDFSPASGFFDPLTILGGPLQHVESNGVAMGCTSTTIPSQAIDPNLQGGTDPVTGLSELGLNRAMGERAGPPYIGRGLMEAVYFGTIAGYDDPTDSFKGNSSLLPQPDPAICPGDCIFGRHNESMSSLSFIGGEPVQRLGRFGLRGAGTTMIQFDVGGTQGEIGLTSPFLPTEQNNIGNTGFNCDQVPDPELEVGTVLELRAMIRLFAPPAYAPELIGSVQSPVATQVQQGAALFGIDLPAFLSRTQPGMTPTNLGDADADHGIAKDRMLNCVGCHVPITKTGNSPAGVGAQHLSNKWAPLFSDLITHKMTSLPSGKSLNLSAQLPPGISRNLADNAIPVAVTGIIGGNEWRTPPLMGVGKTGAPFMHDARVFLNITGKHIPNPDPVDFPNDGQADPNDPAPPAQTTFTSASTLNGTLMVDNLDHAIQAAIELHDLPPAPAVGATIAGQACDPTADVTTQCGNTAGAPPVKACVSTSTTSPTTGLCALSCAPGSAPMVANSVCYATCPSVPFANDICSRNSEYRSEARNTMEKWHALTDAQQLAVIKFLESL
jgi:CxxC motif-containing protein (DUF1111 family)